MKKEDLRTSPWFSTNRTRNCKCVPYTRNYLSVLVSVNKMCPEHGHEKIDTVEENKEVRDNG